MTLKKLRNEGWNCAIVEKTIPKCFIKQDLFGFIDILALRGSEVLAVQTTTGSNSNERVKKILDHENYKHVRAVGWKVIVHGWRKLKGKWECKIIEL